MRLCRCSWVRVRPWRLKFPLEWVRPCVHGGWVRPAEGARIDGHKARLGITDYLLDWGLGGSASVRGLHVQPSREERRKMSHAVSPSRDLGARHGATGDWRWAVAAGARLLAVCRRGAACSLLLLCLAASEHCYRSGRGCCLLPQNIAAVVDEEYRNHRTRQPACGQHLGLQGHIHLILRKII